MVFLRIMGEPMGKQRPKFSVRNGFGRAYTPEKTLNYENLVKHEYMCKYEKTKFGRMAFNANDCIEAVITAYFPIPKADEGKKGLTKSGREKREKGWKCNTKADLDNIAKICLDSLNGIAYPDDRQITSLTVKKYWSKSPRVEIFLGHDFSKRNEE